MRGNSVESVDFIANQASILKETVQTSHSGASAGGTPLITQTSADLAGIGRTRPSGSEMKVHRDQLFLSNMNQSNVFKELIPNPTQKEGVKRSLEMHIEDILCNCSMKGKCSISVWGFGENCSASLSTHFGYDAY